MIGINRDLDDKFKNNVKYVLECVGCEANYLYLQHKDIEFEQYTNGLLVTVGFINDDISMPVNISMGISNYKSMRILQWEAVSNYVDYNLINNWIKYHYPNTPKTDVNNFHHIIHSQSKLEIAQS